MMEEEPYSETLIYTYQATRRHKPQNHIKYVNGEKISGAWWRKLEFPSCRESNAGSSVVQHVAQSLSDYHGIPYAIEWRDSYSLFGF